MKKRVGFLLLIALISINLVIANELLINERVLTEQPISTDYGEFVFTFFEGENKTLVNSPHGRDVSVETGSCGINDFYEACVHEVNISHHNYTQAQVNVYLADVDVSRRTDQVSLSTIFPKSTFLIGEKTDATLRFKNEISTMITNVNVSIELPSFSIQEYNTCKVEGNKIFWRGDLDPKQQKICTFTMLAVDDNNYKVGSIVSFNTGYGGEEIIANTTPLEIKPHQLKVNGTLENEVEAGFPFNLEITLENLNDDEDITVSEFEIVVPSNVAVVDYDNDLKLVDNKLRWTGKVENSENLSFNIFFESQKAKKLDFVNDVSYKISGIKNEFQKTYVTNATSAEPEIILLLSENPVLTNANPFIVFRVRNKGSNTSVYNLMAEIRSDIVSGSGSLDVLDAGENATIVAKAINVKNLNLGKHTIVGELFWQDKFNVQQSATSEIKLEIVDTLDPTATTTTTSTTSTTSTTVPSDTGTTTSTTSTSTTLSEEEKSDNVQQIIEASQKRPLLTRIIDWFKDFFS